MKKNKLFLIIDGYTKESRDQLENSGMTLAWKLYVQMLHTCIPDAEYNIWLPSDEGVETPAKEDLSKYDGILWTGCSLSVLDTSNSSIINQIELAKNAYEVGAPSFGSCWGLQISVVAAGGKIGVNPKGREMGIARKIGVTPEGSKHPLMASKPAVFEAFISHDDYVTELPDGAVLLAGNDFTSVQALSVTHKKGTFWSVQYHPEYNLHEMARLIAARAEKLIRLGFYKNKLELEKMVSDMETLYENPDSKDLRWQLAIDDDVLSPSIRQCEFRNWVNHWILSAS